jgi:HupE / UreJ protein
MSELLAFLHIGLRHIVAWDAADHVLFLLVLAAIYRGKDWRAALLVISAFTVGHSVTLLLAVTNIIVLPARIVEFLIPVTIIATGIENLVMRERAASGSGARHRPVFALLFGLVHGAGFAGYLKSLFVDQIAVPLLGFNIGIELGQIVVLLAASALFIVVDRALTIVPTRVGWPDAFQLRLIGVSAAITLVATTWAFERLPR